MVTNNRNQCAYEYEHLTETSPADIVTLSRPPETTWCPHTISPGQDVEKCLFHGIDEEYPREKATESFLSALEEGPSRSCFAGAYFPGLNLAGETLTTPDERPLDLRGAIIDGVLDLTDARITVPLVLDEATVKAIEAEDAVFEGPVSLVGTAMRKGIYWKGATVEGGIVANEIEAQYIDWRDLTVNGPVTVRDGSFSSSLKFPRGDVDGRLVLSGASFDWHIDATMLSVDGDFDASQISVDGDVDLVGVSTNGTLMLQAATVDGELDCDHAAVGDELRADELTVGESGLFEDVRVRGERAAFDGAAIGGKADFASVSTPNGRFSATDAVFEGEIWFTHAEIAGRTDLSNATLNGHGHLRDAHFGGGLRFENVDDTETETWMAGSTIEGDLSAVNSTFESFQFTATVTGDADFTGTEYASKALFSSSTFEGNVCFDDGLFSAAPDFSDSQFAGKVSFDGTEFMVEPTFEGARFATDPNLEHAEFLTNIDASVEERYRRWGLVFVHPEALENTDLSIPVTDDGSDASVPIALTHLTEEHPGRTQTVLDALCDIESKEWKTVIDDALSMARTATTRVEDPTSSLLVFGFEIGDSTEAEAALQTAVLAGAYERDGDEFAFCHLDQDLSDLDYLVPVPITDAAFEAGARVATINELRTAMVRHERYRLHQLLEGGSEEHMSGVHGATVPVLVGRGAVESS